MSYEQLTLFDTAPFEKKKRVRSWNPWEMEDGEGELATESSPRLQPAPSPSGGGSDSVAAPGEGNLATESTERLRSPAPSPSGDGNDSVAAPGEGGELATESTERLRSPAPPPSGGGNDSVAAPGEGSLATESSPRLQPALSPSSGDGSGSVAGDDPTAIGWVSRYRATGTARGRLEYFRFNWRDGNRIRVCHIPGGNIASALAQSRVSEIERLLISRAPREQIIEIIETWRRSGRSDR